MHERGHHLTSGGSASSSSLVGPVAQERVNSNVRSSTGLSCSGGSQLHVENSGRGAPQHLTSSVGQLAVASNVLATNVAQGTALRESSRHVYQSHRTVATSPSPVTMRHAAHIATSPQNEGMTISASTSRLPMSSPAGAIRAGGRGTENSGSVAFDATGHAYASPQVPMLRPTSIFQPPARHTFGSSGSSSALLTNNTGANGGAAMLHQQIEQGCIAAIREQLPTATRAAQGPQVLYRGRGLEERGPRTTASAPCTPREGRGIAAPPKADHSPAPDGTMSAPSRGPQASFFAGSSLTLPQPPLVRSPALPSSYPRSSSLPHSNRALLHIAGGSCGRKGSSERLKTQQAEAGLVGTADLQASDTGGGKCAESESIPAPDAEARSLFLKVSAEEPRQSPRDSTTLTSDLDIILGSRVCKELSDQSLKMHADLAQLKERVSVIWQQVELHNAYHSEILILKNQHQALRAMAKTTAHKLDGFLKDTTGQAPPARDDNDFKMTHDSIGRVNASLDARFGELKDWVTDVIARNLNTQQVQALEVQSKELRQDVLALQERLSGTDVNVAEAQVAIEEAKATFDKDCTEWNAVREGQEVLLSTILSDVQKNKSAAASAVQELASTVNQESEKVRGWIDEVVELVTIYDTERLTLEMKQEALNVQMDTCQQEVQDLSERMSSLKQPPCEAIETLSKLATDMGCSLPEFLGLLSTTVRAQTVIENKLDPEVQLTQS